MYILAESNTKKRLRKIYSIINKIRESCRKELFNIMINDFGFSKNEVKDYCSMDVFTYGDIDANKLGDRYIIAQIRAEVDYDDLMEIADVLDPIVQTYDKEAYFEAVESGIIQAIIDVENIENINM